MVKRRHVKACLITQSMVLKQVKSTIKNEGERNASKKWKKVGR
jgi:hypothetical protein